MSTLGKYCLILLATTSILAVVLYVCITQFLTEYSPLVGVALQLTIIYFLVSLLSGYMLSNTMQKRPQLFIRAVMGTTVLKLFAYLAALVVYLLLNKGSAAFIVVVFFICYVVFTIVEKVFLLNELRKESK